MAKVKSSADPITSMYPDNADELLSYKYLLGEFGISMLTAISRGAQDPESIMMLSGVPAVCITGRMPILINLDLVKELEEKKYFLTQKGKDFLICIQDHEC